MRRSQAISLPSMRRLSCRMALASPAGGGGGGGEWGGGRRRSCGALGAEGDGMIECQSEGVEIAQAAPAGHAFDTAIQNQRHLLLGQAAVRTQRRVESR